MAVYLRHTVNKIEIISGNKRNEENVKSQLVNIKYFKYTE